MRQQEQSKSLTGFQKRVYEIVKRIPSAKVLTYKEVAKLAGRPRAFRAVGNVLNKNRNSKIPCHRVIKSNGKIGGYRYGKKRKTSLLKREGVIIRKGRVLT